jgi:hypothetical protein
MTNESIQQRNPTAWTIAVIVGVILAVPTGWLFSYIGSLVALLGLFFFLFLGHLIGAFVYRVGRRARPVSQSAIILGVTIVAVVGWGTGLFLELATLPNYVAKVALEKTKKLPEGDTPESFMERHSDQVAKSLEQEFPPGGFIGALKWKLTDNVWEVNIEGREDPLPVAYSQSPKLWIIRIVVSLALLWIAIYAQTSPLQRITDKRFYCAECDKELTVATDDQAPQTRVCSDCSANDSKSLAQSTNDPSIVDNEKAESLS